MINITWGMIVLFCWMPAVNITAFFIVSKPFGCWSKFNEWFNDIHTFRQAGLRLLVIIIFAPLYLLPFWWAVE